MMSYLNDSPFCVRSLWRHKIIINCGGTIEYIQNARNILLLTCSTLYKNFFHISISLYISRLYEIIIINMCSFLTDSLGEKVACYFSTSVKWNFFFLYFSFFFLPTQKLLNSMSGKISKREIDRIEWYSIEFRNYRSST